MSDQFPFQYRHWLSTAFRSELLLVISVVVLWVPVAAIFASSQEIWVDEVTQLSGLTLNPVEVAAWLAGDHQYRFEVPDDRMPPLSYWLGWLWTQPFGLSEQSLRTFSILIAGAAAGFVASAARHAWGAAAGWVSGIAFVLSPNVIVPGVEIRAYPVLLLLSSMVFWVVVGLVQDTVARRLRNWIPLSSLCVAAIYTHFFGLVLTGAVFLCLLCFKPIRVDALRLWLANAASIAIASIGLIPFVRAALSMSAVASNSESKPILVPAVRLLYRTLGGHPALAVHSVLPVVVLIGVASALLCAVARPNSRSRIGLGLLLAVGSGFLVVTIVSTMTSGFDAQSPAYNLWMLPPVFIAIGAAAVNDGRLHRLGLAAAGLVLLGNLCGAFTLLNHRTTFAHSAAERIIDRIRAVHGLGRSPNLIVVHDGSGVWGHSYYPLRYTFGSSLIQCVTDHAADGRVLLRRLPELRDTLSESEIRESRFLLVSTHHQITKDLLRHIKGERTLELTDGGSKNLLKELGLHPDGAEFLAAHAASELIWMH